MARFAGKVGYGVNQEVPPGSDIWKDVIVERDLRGDVIRNNSQSSDGDQLNPEITITNSIRVVADAYALANYQNIRYVLWNGVRWKVTSIDVQRPALTLGLGRVYNGPIPK